MTRKKKSRYTVAQRRAQKAAYDRYQPPAPLLLDSGHDPQLGLRDLREERGPSLGPEYLMWERRRLGEEAR